MSSGARVTAHLIEEVTPGVTPTTGSWDTLRLTGNALTPTVNSQVSDEITASRLGQGTIAGSIDIGGELTGELSYGTFDKLLAAAFYSDWVSNVLQVGSTRKTFSITKSYEDVAVHTVFKGAHVSTMAIEIPADGKVTVNFGLACLDYDDRGTTTFATTTSPATTTPFLSSIHVGDVLVDGVSLAGQACISAMTINLDNTLQAQRCIGSTTLGPGAQIATEAAITGTLTMAWSKKAWEVWQNTFTRTPVSIKFPIEDALGNKYEFEFPAVEIDGELPSGGKRDILQAELTYTVAKVSPKITRTPAA